MLVPSAPCLLACGMMFVHKGKLWIFQNSMVSNSGFLKERGGGGGEERSSCGILEAMTCMQVVCLYLCKELFPKVPALSDCMSNIIPLRLTYTSSTEHCRITTGAEIFHASKCPACREIC